MAALPKQGLLASYWIPAVGIGKPEQWVTVPVSEYAKYRLPNGAPQTNVVFLFNATFMGTPRISSRHIFLSPRTCYSR